MTTTQTPDYPIYKFGARWICDGPEGRFSARTKAEAIRLLDETKGHYDTKFEQETERRAAR
jgi:hypothetical protein